MFQWANFEAAASTLAAQGRELIERFRFVLVGTIRSDGTPRISPVEAHIVRGHLMLVMIPGTLKARDLLRDPRLLVNSPITHPDDPNTEFKLRGRVVEIRDQALHERLATTSRLALLLPRYRGRRFPCLAEWGVRPDSLEPRPWPRLHQTTDGGAR